MFFISVNLSWSGNTVGRKKTVPEQAPLNSAGLLTFNKISCICKE